MHVLSLLNSIVSSGGRCVHPCPLGFVWLHEVIIHGWFHPDVGRVDPRGPPNTRPADSSNETTTNSSEERPNVWSRFHTLGGDVSLTRGLTWMAAWSILILALPNAIFGRAWEFTPTWVVIHGRQGLRPDTPQYTSFQMRPYWVRPWFRSYERSLCQIVKIIVKFGLLVSYLNAWFQFICWHICATSALPYYSCIGIPWI